MPAIDRWILIRHTDLAEIGVYAVSIKIASLMGLLVGAFQIAFGPYAFSIWDKENASDTFGRLLKLYFVALTFLCVVITGFGDVVIRLVASNKYSASIVPLPPLLCAYIFQGSIEFTLLGILWAKKSVGNFFVSFVSVVVLFLANFLLVPHLTILGAGVSLLLAKVAMTVVAYLLSSRYYRLEVKLGELLLVLGLACPTYALVYMDHYLNHPLLAVLKYMSVLLFPLFCFMAVFDVGEKQQIRFYLGRLFELIRLKSS